jgi:hypothetical protein
MGSSYFLQAGTIHRVIVTERPCVTMLMTQERHIEIFAYGNEINETPFERRLVNLTEAEKVTKILDTIA